MMGLEDAKPRSSANVTPAGGLSDLAPSAPQNAVAAPMEEGTQAGSMDMGAIRQRLQAAIDLLQGPLGEQFDDPKFREAALAYDAFLNDGEKPDGVTSQGLYEFGTRLFTRELRTGVGEELPDGSTIATKKLVAAYRDGDDVILELDIRATKPDGTTFDYRAPVTRGRTSKATDEVLRIPAEAIQDRVRGARFLAMGIEQAGGRDAAIAGLQQQMQALDQQGAA